MSTQIDLGPVLSVPKGDWKADVTYEKLNLVRHKSAAWVCNVDTSTGVEPTVDSADWYLLVTDTSSVSSVNGMKGDVQLTDIATPNADDDSTKITNTEWVRDRLDATLNAANTFTTDSITEATTSILDAAASDATNKANTAVTQAMAAGDSKYAAKDALDNVSNVASEALSRADACLPLSGGTMEGTATSITDRGFYHEGSTGLGFSAKNTTNGKKVTFGVGSSGSKGIYDDDTSSWMFQKDASGNYKIGDKYPVLSINGANASATGDITISSTSATTTPNVVVFYGSCDNGTYTGTPYGGGSHAGKGKFKLPSGGTWRYTIAGYKAAAGQVSGGSTISPSYQGGDYQSYASIIAVRVS